jgi:hypothetical protein
MLTFINLTSDWHGCNLMVSHTLRTLFAVLGNYAGASGRMAFQNAERRNTACGTNHSATAVSKFLNLHSAVGRLQEALSGGRKMMEFRSVQSIPHLIMASRFSIQPRAITTIFIQRKSLGELLQVVVQKL